MNFIRRRRRLAVAGIAILMCSVTLMGTALFAPSTRAMTDQEFHDAFKAGCESTPGNSFVENPDGSYQCNLKDGGVIKCTNASTPCTYTQPLTVSNVLGIVKASGLNAVQTGNPTPTATRPIRSVIGGIVATIGPAKLPPETAYLFGRSWTCPANISHDFNTLFLKCNPDNSIEFSVFGASLAQQHPHGGFTYSGVAPGNYTEREIVPNGYGVDLTTFCSVASSNQYPPANTFHPVVVYQGYYEFQVAAGQYVYCEWFNTPPSTVTPNPTRVVKGVIGGVLQNPQKAQANSGPASTPAAGTPAP